MLDSPASPKVSRRLAAILAADIAGYSALMGADDVRTVRDLKGHQTALLPMIAEHGGPVIDTAGDGILAEFASVVNAVEYAVAMQKTMAERNAMADPACRMQFRIGINIGDVIHDETRLYGDGVNVAARLQSIAEPGGICLSGEAHGQVHRKLPLTLIDLGEQQLKNISAPVRVYRVDWGDFATTAPTSRPTPALLDKPSIAVLAFNNMSGEAEQEYFSDRISEDIITDLSKLSELHVIARNSTFTYKGQAVDVKQVGRELGVRYVLEGSVRKSGIGFELLVSSLTP
jgi:adenylate cyclase